MNVAQVILGAAIGTKVSESMKEGEGNGGPQSPDEPIPDPGQDPEMKGDKLNELVEIERKNRPAPDSVDSYAGDTVTIPAGGRAIITVTPTDGFDLRVKRVYYDRRADHSYTHMVDGAELSDNHQLLLQSPRRIRNGGKVVSVVENNSSSASTVDFELEGWAIPEGGS